MPLFRPTVSGVSVTVRVTPRAGKNAISGVRDDVLIALLSAALHIPKRDITIAAGERSRTKRVVVAAATAQDMGERLAVVLAAARG